MTMGAAIFGKAEFGDGEEYRQFQYRFTLAILLFSGIVTGLFHLAVAFGPSIFDPVYMVFSRSYLGLSFLFFGLLRNHPRRLDWIAPVFSIASIGLQITTLTLNTADELRIIWFILNLPGTYLILGPRWGIVVTAVTVVIILTVNAHLEHPYTPSAVITAIMGLLYTSAFFHAFSAKSISFHHAMVKANRALAELASKDPLTGLFNARAFYGLCEAALHQAQRSQSSFAMLFIDLDHFKHVNDTYGHEAGDKVLSEVAHCLAGAARQSDVVGRIGGEEFSILLPDTDLDGAQVLGEKIRREIEALNPDIGDRILPVTASIGVACGGPQSPSIAHVQHRADEAMYVAKRAGRNRVTCLDQLADNP